MWEKLKGKIITHWYTLGVVNYVCSGRVDATIYYDSCPFESGPQYVPSPTYKIVEELPKGSYPPVKVQAGMLKAAKNKAAAQCFLQLLLKQQTQKTLAKLGERQRGICQARFDLWGFPHRRQAGGNLQGQAVCLPAQPAHGRLDL